MQQSWLQLWPIQELSELNEGYEVSSYPFLFNEEDVSEIGNSFKEFLIALNRPL
jgi:hypothetical protein